jgi:rsbT antagonist protein RsbS
MATRVSSVGGVLLVSIDEDLDDMSAEALRNDVSSEVSATGARGVLLDVSVLDTIDSFLGRVLAELASCSALMGAETVVSGIRPAVAITLVELGLALPGLRTALDVTDGLALLGVSVRRTGPATGSGAG